jgi:molybdopterin/thiamine biosynthesis adenylyltransferase
MLPDGSMFGRVILQDLSFDAMSKITVAGDQLLTWPRPAFVEADESGTRTAQLFGEQTYAALRNLKVGVVGCSGTGSPVIEQLLRYQVGTLVIVDPDKIEYKNLNRILNSRRCHAENGTPKVDLVCEVAELADLGTTVIPFPKNLYESRDAVMELASCDVLIGCMDTAEGRDLLNKLSTFYLVLYMDMGISIESDGKGGINKIEASVHFIQPGRSSLLSRGVYSMDEVVAESLLRRNPAEYQRLVAEGRKSGHKYIKDVNVDRPAVVSLNMQVASTAINELLNRIHPYKISQLQDTTKIAIDITDNFMVPERESDFVPDKFLIKRLGRGDIDPMLDCVQLSAAAEVVKQELAD